MKTAFCIGCYPSNDILNQLLKDNIKVIRENTDFDIFLSTHYENIDREIINMVDYFIYDKNNEFVDKSHTPTTISTYSQSKIVIYNGGHGLPVFRNINNLTKFSGSLGYDFFYYCEGDIVFSKNDIQKIFLLKDKCDFYQKNLFIRSSINDNNLYIGNEDYAANVDLTFFGGKLDFWNKNIRLPHNNKEWEDFYWVNWVENNQSIERVFYLKYKDLLKNEIVIENGLEEYFQESLINEYSFKELITTPLYNNLIPSSPVILIHNKSEKEYTIKASINDSMVFDQICHVLEYHIFPFNFNDDGQRIEIICMDNDKIVKRANFKLKTIEELKNLGEIY